MAVMASVRFYATYTELKRCYRFMAIKPGKPFIQKKKCCTGRRSFALRTNLLKRKGNEHRQSIGGLGLTMLRVGLEADAAAGGGRGVDLLVGYLR